MQYFGQNNQQKLFYFYLNNTEREQKFGIQIIRNAIEIHSFEKKTSLNSNHCLTVPSKIK